MRSVGFLWLSLLASAGSPTLQRALSVELEAPVIVDIAVMRGDITVGYSRDGQVSIYAFAQDSNGRSFLMETLQSRLAIEQVNNRITIRDSRQPADLEAGLRISYRIDVPSRTEVKSSISVAGNQTVVGVSGPVTVVTSVGDIDVSYVDTEVVKAETGRGNISCSRAARVEAATGSGNITLMENGPSKAIVKKGVGRIEVGGARGSFEGSTDKGEVHLRAVLWDDWRLTSASGNLRVELPKGAKFEVDLATGAGEISLARTDMKKLDAEARQYRQKVNGGGKVIYARSQTGSISIE